MVFSNNTIVAIAPDWRLLPRLTTLQLDGNGLSSVPTSLLADTNVTNLSLAGNSMTKKAFLRTDGIEPFLERRKKSKNKEVGVFVCRFAI